jgi:hypothetical protein
MNNFHVHNYSYSVSSAYKIGLQDAIRRPSFNLPKLHGLKSLGVSKV